MRHSISSVFHQAVFASGPCAWLAIDGIPLERWLADHLQQPQVAQHALSLMWLHREEEEAIAVRRLTPEEDGTSTLVPLLVCSSDMDLGCSVLVVEQLVEGDTVQWCRFGWSVSGGVEVGISTRWIKDCGPVIFTLSEFNQALRDLSELRLRPLEPA